jgi:Bacterial CdiA-CT RNAse A domain
MQWFAAPHRFVCIAVAFGLCGLVSCQPPATNDAPRVSSTERVGLGDHSAHGAERDLSRDEAAGGHILRKHVGQTDDELRDRLRREPRITGASTYTDRATADRAVGEAIAQSPDRIERWLNRAGGHPNLVIDYDSPVPIGRTINRGESESHTCAHAIVVLKYSGTNDYYVLTSYPECRS